MLLQLPEEALGLAEEPWGALCLARVLEHLVQQVNLCPRHTSRHEIVFEGPQIARCFISEPVEQAQPQLVDRVYLGRSKHLCQSSQLNFVIVAAC